MYKRQVLDRADHAVEVVVDKTKGVTFVISHRGNAPQGVFGKTVLPDLDRNGNLPRWHVDRSVGSKPQRGVDGIFRLKTWNG